MPPPDPISALAISAMTLARNRAAVMEELRRLLPGMTRGHKAFPFGLAALDCCLPEGGLPCGALHEIVPAPYATPAALGFIAAILGRLTSPPPERGRSANKVSRVGGTRINTTPPRRASWMRVDPPLSGEGKTNARWPHSLVFVLPTYGFGPYGRLHGHGLRALGLDPARLVLVETAHRKDTLWAIEEAVRSGAPAAVAGVIDKLNLKTSQRLQFAATEAGLPIFLMRPSQNLESSAAATRWRVGTAEAARDRFGLIARPRWHLQLERARNGRPGEWVVEYDHVAHRFSLAAGLADSARARGTGEGADRKTYCA
ncbi:MAG: ImuA family protein [Xanthobacteraceae bacterium]